MIRVIEHSGQAEDIAALKSHIQGHGGKLHVAVHPFFSHYVGSGVTESWFPWEKEALRWVKGRMPTKTRGKVRRVVSLKEPIIILEDRRFVEQTRQRLEKEGVHRPVFIIPTREGHPEPVEGVGGWDFFDALNVKKTFLGGSNLWYAFSPDNLESNAKKWAERALVVAREKVGKARKRLEDSLTPPEKHARFELWARGQLMTKTHCLGFTFNRLSEKMPVVLLPNVSGPQRLARRPRD